MRLVPCGRNDTNSKEIIQIRTESQPPVLWELYVANQKVGQLLEVVLRGKGIAPEDTPLYNALDRVGALTPGELATLLGIAPSTLSYRLARLIRAGQLERLPHPTDGRSAVIRLTVEGRGAWERVFPEFRAALAAVEARLSMPPHELEQGLLDISSAVDAELTVRAAGEPQPAPPG